MRGVHRVYLDDGSKAYLEFRGTSQGDSWSLGLCVPRDALQDLADAGVLDLLDLVAELLDDGGAGRRSTRSATGPSVVSQAAP